jgi:transcriptional regulator with XRE-family HTH domain
MGIKIKTDVKVDIRGRVKELCRKKNITQAQLAAMLEITDISLNKSLRNNNPSLQTLQRIADALEVHISELLKGCEADMDAEEPEMVALVEYGGRYYRANSLPELRSICTLLESKK